ncbi:unnamed protein product [Chondrus crispus]|uniref:Uncharacterized protein n=1 Tax=Chondrus crispus TaxID=2769 RepID=R7QIH8_CHOCR|nr:unnamed protein product [Chondrus crispus]CDF37225.1 unnamed protein product [Chondrus crispus]|eukprot:XP_005717044.1 unnamed protein product [Chondrus crispus]
MAKRPRPRAVEDDTARRRKRPAFPPEEDDWKKFLTPVVGEYRPRCSMARLRRAALPALLETPAARKKTLNMERKAMIAANATGVFRMPSKDRHDDPLRVAAMRFGCAAPWSKLMQTAMPLVTPRAQKKRGYLAPQERSFMTAGGMQITGLPPGKGSAKQKQEAQLEKQIGAVKQAVPTLVGSLMYLRGMGGKELASSSLHQMDVPQAPVAKTSSVFHGQKYFAETGAFEMDTRTSASIKLPLATATPFMPSAKPGASANASSVSAAVDARQRKFPPKTQAPAAVPPPAPAAPVNHQPVTKKQRISKAQRGPGTASAARMANGQTQVRPVQTPRKSTSSRSSAGTTGTNVKAANTADSHQLPTVGRTPAQITASKAASAAMSAASAAASSQYLTQEQLAMQAKGAFRPMHAPTSVSPSVRVGTVQSLPTVAGAPAGMHVNMKGGARAGKARAHASPSQSNAAMIMRAVAAKKTKTPSPSQASSRSGERLPMHRGSPMTTGAYHDPMLLATSQQNATTSAMNRINQARGVSPKSQMDFHQAAAQVNAHAAGREIVSSGMSRSGVLHTSPMGQLADKLATQLPQQTLRGMTPQGRAKHARMAAVAAQKNRQPQAHGQLRKDDVIQNPHDLEAQLRRADVLPADMVPGKAGKLNDPSMFGKGPNRNNLMMNQAGHASQGFYSNALGAQSAQLGHNTPINQRNLMMLRMAHANRNPPIAAGAGAPGAPNILQNMQDLHRPMQNLGVVPGMQPSAHGANMFNFLQVNGLSGGMPQAGGMNNPVVPGMAGKGMPTGPNAGMMNPHDAIFQQMLTATRGPGMNSSAPLHAGPMTNPTAPLNVHGHQVVTTGPMRQIPAHLGVQQSSDPAAIHEIDRALRLSFDESDLMG